MAFSTNCSLNWITGILIHVKHIYKSVEVLEISISYKLAVNAFITRSSLKSLDLFFKDQRKKDSRKNNFHELNDLSQKRNFLEIVKLVAKFDPVLKNHIDEISKKKLKNEIFCNFKNTIGL